MGDKTGFFIPSAKGEPVLDMSVFRAAKSLTKIRGLYSGLGTAQKLIADEILRDPQGAVSLTIRQLAARCSVGYSTVCRFCEQLGFSGYRDFRNRLAQDLMEETGSPINLSDYEFHRGNTAEQVCRETFALCREILEDCAGLLDPSQVRLAAQYILSARSLHIIGTGASASSAMYAHTRLLRLGIPCSVCADPMVFLMESAMMQPGDVLLAVSSSGRTVPIVQAASNAAENGAKVIGVCDFSVSPLQELSHCCLCTTGRNVRSHLNVDLHLTIGQIAILDILYSCCCIAQGPQGRLNYLQTREAIRFLKEK